MSKQTLFKKSTSPKYSGIVSFKSVEEAKKSCEKLQIEFHNAKSRKKKLRIARVANYASNRALASSRRKNLYVINKGILERISEIYGGTAKLLFRKYKIGI